MLFQTSTVADLTVGNDGAIQPRKRNGHLSPLGVAAGISTFSETGYPRDQAWDAHEEETKRR